MERYACDKSCNNYGYRLIDLCKSLNIHVVNGRCGGDKFVGSPTTLHGSLIDYVLMSPELFVNVSTFDILNFDPLLSDVHKPVTFSLSCTGMSLNQENFESQNEDDTNNTGNQYVEKPVWNTKNRQDFIDAFDHGAIDIIIGKLNPTNFS